MTDVPRSRLASIAKASHEQFQREERLLSFQQYLEKLEEDPHRLTRNSAEYLFDAIRYFEVEDVDRPLGVEQRYQIFDGGQRSGDQRVVGNEKAQHTLMQLLDNFRREGKVNRLIVIHGPNGSAKTSFVNALFNALEIYSRTEEGALYRFHWVFPVAEPSGGSIGFGGYKAKDDGRESYAFLDDDEIDAKLPSEHNDNPIFLLPTQQRAEFLENIPPEKKVKYISQTALHGALGHRSRKVFDALMTAYRGDLRRVLKHVQVERLFISRRYRRAAVTVEPQLHIDAGVRQLTIDRSLKALPKVLQSQSLFEVEGPLVEGNRGLIEFNDFLKRPMKANKYLLATGEKGTITLKNRVVHLDSVLIGTANETYLEGLKNQPDWGSYRGRLEFIRMGYLLDYREEAKIYDDLLDSISTTKPVTPGTTRMLGLWAVMTRLQQPSAEGLDKEISVIVKELEPLDKALLYADGVLPRGLSPDQQQLLRASVQTIADNGSAGTYYEGRVGVSPRELSRIILSEVHSDSPTVSPLRLFQRLEQLTDDRSMFEWLRIDPVGSYHRPASYIDDVREYFLTACEQDIRVASGLVEENAHRRLFERYVQHANAFLKNEQLVDPVTGRSTDPDADLMEKVESRMGIDADKRTFRSNQVSRIAAFRIEHPEDDVNYETIFPDLLSILEDAYFRGKQADIEQRWAGLLEFYEEDSEVETDDAEEVRRTHQRLVEQFGYTRETAQEVVAALYSERREGREDRKARERAAEQA